MAESSTQSIVIAAAPAAIMAVIADFPAYPQWADAVKEIKVVQPGAKDRVERAERVRFRIDAGLFKDSYELAYQWADDGLSVSWELVSGEMQKSQHGSYLLRPIDGGARTEVVYTLAVELSVPLLGMLRRKAERMIMDTALKELRKRVESGS